VNESKRLVYISSALRSLIALYEPYSEFSKADAKPRNTLRVILFGISKKLIQGRIAKLASASVLSAKFVEL
jgi:hypothetical protein